MPNLKQVLEIISKKLGDDSSLSKAINAENLNEVEFDDAEFERISTSTSSLLTPDAAVNNPEIIEKFKESIGAQMKGSIYSRIESQLREVAPKLGMSFDEADKASDMLTKMKDFEFKKNGGGDLDKYIQEIDGLNKQLAKVKETSSEEINKIKGDYSQKELNSAVERQLSRYDLAEAYNKDVVRQGIFDSVNKKLRESFVPKVTDSGSIDLFQKDMPDKLVYSESNKPMTFQDFVDPIMKDYVKKVDKNPVVKPSFEDERKKLSTFVPNSMGASLAKQREEAFKMPN